MPYLLFGLAAGVLVDRSRRKPVLVGTDLGRSLRLVSIPVLYFADALTVWTLLGFVFCFGTLSVVFEAADQSFLPRLVPGVLLTPAFARIEQADAVARTTGQMLAGLLVRLVGAPVAMLGDAVSYLLSGVLILPGTRCGDTAASG